MGVLGLWKLVDATGKTVPLETLEGKVLAVDVSIWIHQVIQGYQDRRGNMLPNAHLIGLFNRICKLMYFKIKPIFVFDGGVPLLKKNTIATRRKLKSIAASKAQKLKNDLINNLMKHTAVKEALDNKDGTAETKSSPVKDSAIAGPSKLQDIYKLPEMPSIQIENPEDYIDSEDEPSPRKQKKWMGNIHQVNINDEEFKNLPADVRYDILTDLKETRKQNSWGRINEMPAGSDNYSGFQVGRLIKRRNVQESLEAAEKEMGGKTLTLEELDQLLTDQGINTTKQPDAAFRIASDSTTRVVYVKDKVNAQISEKSNDSNHSSNSDSKIEKDHDSNSNEVDSKSVCSNNSVAVIDDISAYDLDAEWDSDEGFTTEVSLNESQLLPKSVIPKSVMNPALSYMLENSGLTKDQILRIVEQSKRNKEKSDASSNSSSKKGKRKSNPKSLKNAKKSKLVNKPFMKASPEIKEETSLDNDECSIVLDSSSKPDDYIDSSLKTIPVKKEEISNVENIGIISSESESDDFIEIQDAPSPELLDNKIVKEESLQITIKPSEELEDDIFADVFSGIRPTTKSDMTSKENSILSKDESNTHFDFSKHEPFMQTIDEESEADDEMVQIDEEKIVSDNEANNVVNNIVISETEFGTSPTTPPKYTPTGKRSLNFENCEIASKIVASMDVDRGTTKADVEPVEKLVNAVNKEENEVVENAVIDNINLEDFNDDFTEDFICDQINDDKKIEKPPLILPTDEKELELMKDQLETEQEQLAGSLGKLERQAVDITDQMRLEAQELLRLFGVPYIVAPMEAEAQCAHLEQIKLTDGTITDDSDIWLFGGHCVYKNFFDNNKRVLQFLSNDIEHHFKLSRKELIQLALLVGSDYTNGLSGVGPVTALEILASFPSDGEDILRGLRSFCSWYRAGKFSAPGKVNLRNKLKSVQIEKGFPSQAVVQAYLCPMVDESNEAFTWGKPNLVLLCDYVRHKFSWTKLKFEETMNPVLKKMSETKSQKGIAAYFKVRTIPKSIETTLSKRVQNAVQKLGGKVLEEDSNGSNTQKKSKKVGKTGKRSKKTEEGSVESSDKNEVEDALQNVEDINKPSTSKEVGEDRVQNDSDAVAEDDPEKKLKDHIEKLKRRRILNAEVEEIIPQREQDKADALKRKLKAIEIYRKSKMNQDKNKKKKRIAKKLKEDAELSESSSDD